MRMPRLSPRQQAGLAVALALLLWMPQGISTADHTVVTGHSTFYNGSGYDPCLSSIAGILRSRVMWFNDMVLAERYGGKGTFIFVTQNGSDDPTRKNYLYTEGVYYDFVDPNGAHWHVEEAFYSKKISGSYSVEPDPSSINAYNPQVGADVEPISEENRVYVWFVELAATPIYDQFAGSDPHDLYNFLVMVDTCKMKTAFNGNVSHDTAEELSTQKGHPVGATTHEHETYIANLWIGKRPLLMPLGGASAGGAPSSWESAWAAGYAEQQVSATNVSTTTNDGPNNSVEPEGNRTTYDD